MAKCVLTESHHVTGAYVPPGRVVEYTYCDRCGSFNIGVGDSHRRMDPLLVYVILASYMLAAALMLLTRNILVCLGIGLVGLVALVIYSGGKHLQCNTCGNEHITGENVLHYPNDAMKLDVPDELLIKHIRKK